jgi:hypothetical protein
MADLREDTAGSTRSLPISPELKILLLEAAESSNVDLVRVISGGQCPKGECSKRIGSVRHDNGKAADLQLYVDGKRQLFTDAAGLEIFKAFVTASATGGATGIGAGVHYMGAATIHVGYGTRAVWGAGGKSANAPEWLIEAVKAGWAGARFSAELVIEKSLLGIEGSLDSEDEELEEDQVELTPPEE